MGRLTATTHTHRKKGLALLGRVTMLGDGRNECGLFDTIMTMNTPVGNIDIVF